MDDPDEELWKRVQNISFKKQKSQPPIIPDYVPIESGYKNIQEKKYDPSVLPTVPILSIHEENELFSQYSDLISIESNTKKETMSDSTLQKYEEDNVHS
jgi:hypothetical protein